MSTTWLCNRHRKGLGMERYVKQIVDDVMEMAAKIQFLEAKVAAAESWNAEQLADAQATVEALQRERDQWKEAFERSCDDTAHLKAALDAEREKAAQQGRYAVDLFDEIQRMKKAWCEERAGFESDLVKAETERDKLQALVRALPEMVGTITVEQISQTGTNWALFDAGGWIATVDGKRVAKALKSLLQYRATMDASGPAGGGRGDEGKACH